MDQDRAHQQDGNRVLQTAGAPSPVRMLTTAFVIGALVGAGTALLLTPKRGSVIRRRLRRGAAAAGGELADMAVETRDALEALGKDARRTLRRTASMIGSVFQATKEAITTDVDGKGHT